VNGDDVSSGSVCLSCQNRAGSDDTCYLLCGISDVLAAVLAMQECQSSKQQQRQMSSTRGAVYAAYSDVAVSDTCTACTVTLSTVTAHMSTHQSTAT
jgi:hypothetical protein